MHYFEALRLEGNNSMNFVFHNSVDKFFSLKRQTHTQWFVTHKQFFFSTVFLAEVSSGCPWTVDTNFHCGREK